jgi:hypothetical protein
MFEEDEWWDSRTFIYCVQERKKNQHKRHGHEERREEGPVGIPVRFFGPDRLHTMNVRVIIRPRELFTAPPVSTQTKGVDGIGLVPRVLHRVTIIGTGLGVGKFGTIFKTYFGFGMVGIVIVHIRVVVVERAKVGKHVGYG